MKNTSLKLFAVCICEGSYLVDAREMTEEVNCLDRKCVTPTAENIVICHKDDDCKKYCPKECQPSNPCVFTCTKSGGCLCQCKGI
ncbi:unnamed protein product [Eruca vesicaria subsp. sativa]|uniref:Uncharacterized protein n=1 Tax=Eruca vesicaria subsp. sativa TaxID=29727 RepID=A0ABC8JYV3_ERUVS|nr:unnamed protein product [Eruca vesicaria subsp. sativa]